MLSTLLAFSKSLTQKVIVRGAPAIRKYNTATMSTTERLYAPFRKHAELFDGEEESSFLLKYLHEDYVQILDAMQKLPVDDDVDPDTVVPNLLKKEMDGVYSFNVFDKSFIQLFNEEIENFYYISEREHIPVRRPNSMNNYGVVVNEIGLRPLITSFQQEYLWPLARRLFPIQASQFDDHHAFIVRYRANEDLGLDMHTDASDVVRLVVSSKSPCRAVSHHISLFYTFDRLLTFAWVNLALPVQRSPFVACLERPTIDNTRTRTSIKLDGPFYI